MRCNFRDIDTSSRDNTVPFDEKTEEKQILWAHITE